MGRIVFAAAMSHVLDPEYYGTNVGPAGRRSVEASSTKHSLSNQLSLQPHLGRPLAFPLP